jgi:putative flippase GtrA
MREWLARRRQLALYVAGGVASALIDVGLMQALIDGGATPLLAASAGFGAGLLFNYLYHLRVTFAAAAAHAPRRASLARYLAVVAANYGLTLACVAAAVALGALPVAGKLVALPLVAASGFVLGKRWIFA